MPFRDASGIECILLTDLVDGPISVPDGATLVPGPSGRSLRDKNDRWREAVMGSPIEFFCVFDYGPASTSSGVARNWRFRAVGVSVDETAERLGMSEMATPLDPRFSTFDAALEYADQLNCCAGIMDS